MNSDVNAWLTDATDEETQEKIRFLQASDPKGLAEAFRGKLQFGTGGVRALMGVGPARLNIYTIRAITQGLCDCLLAREKGALSIVIGHDCRHHSHTFAEQVAKVCAGNGIKAYLIEELRPTPFISFLMRKKKASAAINITASHNPKEYSGYKVYGKDGAQITAPLDKEIIKHVEKITDFSQIKTAPSDSHLIHSIGDECDIDYLKAVDTIPLHPKQNHEEGKKLKIIYSPLHGAGITLIPRLLHRWGFTDVELVEEQMIPDGDFPTAPKPNPEEPEALELGMQQLIEKKGDIFIATDPDADRFGVVAKTPVGLVRFSGNEMACILLEQILFHLKKEGRLPKNGAVIKTIVTTELFAKIAANYNVQCLDLLTGFKYIGEKIHEWEQQPNSPHFIFGAEESYGCLFGTHARDKDACVAAGLVADIALDAKQQGKTLNNLLQEIYAHYGIFRQRLETIPLQGSCDEILDTLRNNPPQEIDGHKVVSVEDYKKETGLPISNVLLYRLENEGKLVIRGSGTEPKLKIYAELKGNDINECDEALKTLVKWFQL